MAASIENIYARSTCIGNNYIISTWIKYTGIESNYIKEIFTKSAFIRDIEPKTFAKLKIILTNLKINDCYLQLLIKLFFALIDNRSC